MEGFDERTYGDAFADVYDDWYADLSDVEDTVTTLLGLAGDGASILELGVGTGRIAVPLARAGAARCCTVTGVDASDAMLAQLARHDTDGIVRAVRGSMAFDLPAGPFGLAFVAYNTLFNLTGDGEQAACFGAVAERLDAGGRFVVEAFVPEPASTSRDDVSVRRLAADHVVLSVSVERPDRQLAEGQFVEISEHAGIRLRPWSIRYATVDQLDTMANAAGFDVEARWSSFTRAAFDDTSERHVTTYRLG